MNFSNNIGHVVAVGAALVGVLNCSAGLPPADLVTARASYQNASEGPAQQVNPAQLHTAKEQLARAEASFTENGDTQGTRDQAYVAIRTTELAVVVARTKLAPQNQANVEHEMHDNETQAVARTSAELSRTKAELATQSATLEAERVRRVDAEKRAAQAAADLAKVASVKQEARGTVITLSGAVLFESGKWDLLPGAQLKLNDVATALTEQDPLSKMVVEGHTDSQGSATFNQDLSQHRAQAVRDYLVSRGIASDRISAQGFGLTRSIADNTSTEGRANNRRVEIVVLRTP